MATLFDKYGGCGTFIKIASSFYSRVLESDALSAYFRHIDMDSLVVHQAEFLSTALSAKDQAGGPFDLKEHHQRLSITEQSSRAKSNFFASISFGHR